MIVACATCGLPSPELGRVFLGDALPFCVHCGLPLVPRPPDLADVVPKELLAASDDELCFDAEERGGNKRVLLRVARGRLSVEKVAQVVERAARLSRLVNEHVLSVRSFGAVDERWYVVSDAVHGGDLDDLARRGGALPAAAALRFLRDALLGLAHVHERGMPHGDLRATNLLVSRAGSLRLTGFALAGDLDARSARADLFALGRVFARLCAGLDITDASPVVLRHRPGVFELAPGLPAPLERALERLLGRDPAGPFESAAGAADTLLPLIDAASDELCRDLVDDPAGTSSRAAQALAKRHVARAYELRAGAPLAAGLFAYRALALCRDEPAIAAAYQELVADHLLHFDELHSPERDAIERALAGDSDDAGAWLRLGRLYFAHGNPYRAVTCWKRYLRRRPGDGSVAAEVNALTWPGESEATPPVPALARAPADTTEIDLLAGLPLEDELLARMGLSGPGGQTSTTTPELSAAPMTMAATPGTLAAAAAAAAAEAAAAAATREARERAESPFATDSTVHALAELRAGDASDAAATSSAGAADATVFASTPAAAEPATPAASATAPASTTSTAPTPMVIPALLAPGAFDGDARSTGAVASASAGMVAPRPRPVVDIEIETPRRPGEYWAGPGKRFAAAFALLMATGIAWHWYKRPPASESGPAALGARILSKRAHFEDAVKRLNDGDEGALAQLKAMLRGGAPPPRAILPPGAPQPDWRHGGVQPPKSANGSDAPSGPMALEPLPGAVATPADRSREPDPHFESHLARIAYHQAEQEFRERRYRDAIATLDRLIRASPQSLWFGFQAILLRAQSYAAQGDRTAAAQDYRAVLAVTRSDEETHRRAKAGLRALLRGEPVPAPTWSTGSLVAPAPGSAPSPAPSPAPGPATNAAAPLREEPRTPVVTPATPPPIVKRDRPARPRRRPPPPERTTPVPRELFPFE